jgi:membrane-associated PAP2 superfamily phosphatase
MNARADTFASQRFLLLHVLLIPGALALAAWAAGPSGLDRLVAAAFFDPGTGAFPARASTLLEIIGHRFAKSAVLLLWFTLLAAALTASFLQPLLDRYRAILWATAGAMALGPAIVVALKELNSHQCPWGLRSFGGYADYAAGWFVPAAEVGHCFPSGHGAAGFSLVALSFAGMASGNRRLARAGLATAIAAGVLFSAVRMAQGAHFLSHNLWSAAIDWMAAALVFAPLAWRPETAQC